MKTPVKTTFLAISFLGFAVVAMGQKPKVIVDQDARGPASTDMQSILMFAQSPDVDVLGVTIVTGDQWVKEETAHTLRALEIAGRADIPVVPGAAFYPRRRGCARPWGSGGR